MLKRSCRAWVLVLAGVLSSGAPARADIVFVGDPTASLDLFGSFKSTDANYDTTFDVGTDKASITFGAEGEINASADIVPNGITRAGALEFVVTRKFKIVGSETTVDHVLRADGLWPSLRTRDDVDAFYDLTLAYADKIFEGTTLRSELEDSDHPKASGANQNNGGRPIHLHKANRGIPLPVGEYTLESTIALAALYQDAEWELDLMDGIFDPRGVGFGTDKQGFNSTVVPAPGGAALGMIGLLLVGWLKRRTA